ncbi:response regulator transcription factor [Halapricum salinum]|uniref:response regulator transcription factor n=1 Tax=Halapricum salinum TaxID=1457250 RepID=UPI00067905E4|nr:response regulator [Halapricum salinum]
MSTAPSERGVVLVVEDERHLADLYTDYLSEQYDVRTTYSGDEAIDMLASDIDVVLLDRRMPITSGNEVLAAIEENGLDCRVAMVTAVDPDFEIIDLGVDDYLVKPVSKNALLDVVDRLLTIAEYSDRLQELTSKKLKRNVLEVEKPESELEESDRFAELEADIRRLERDVDRLSEALDEDDVLRQR